MQDAFHQAGIPWAKDSHEDRGDGIFILISGDIPKILFVESLPTALVMALGEHNASHPQEEQIRLGIVLHAGEVNYDEHGATARSINLAFRLLESEELKTSLANSAGPLAFIISSRFYHEVVRDNAADTAAYRRIRVHVKETYAVGWYILRNGSYLQMNRQLRVEPLSLGRRSRDCACLHKRVDHTDYLGRRVRRPADSDT